ncbi:MAG: hypothetical protein D6719_13040 [Candidatus Dadabacteria bacterium]|nr:MAG: hypothetical protein D6719_13040 [Candidatus Dadabacteria bacterium]
MDIPTDNQNVAVTSSDTPASDSGGSDINIGVVLKESWRLTSGVKGKFIGAVVVAVAITLVLEALLGIASNYAGGIVAVIAVFIYVGITAVFMTGIMVMGIKRASGQEIVVNDVFAFFPKFLKLLFTYVAVAVLVMVGTVLLVLPGIYLAVAYIFALPLVALEDLGIWEALEKSRKKVTTYWFSYFGWSFVIMIILWLSALPLGIGLIWTLPMACIGYGILYRNAFSGRG